MLYKENGKKNTYKWIRKIFYELVLPTRFDIGYLRYEIMKISGS